VWAVPAEIELKLAIAASDVPKLARVPLLKAASRGRASTSRLYSIYYDTPELTLQEQGVALRLRRIGTRWVQTLKSAGRVEGGLHQREELETPVPAQILNYPALSQSGAAAVFADPGLPLRLQPVFATDFKRTSWQLEPTTDTEIAFCLDRGAISAGSAQVPISEIELELKSGAPEQLLKFALRLLEMIPLRLEPVSKAERGYALASGLQAAPVKAAAAALQPAMPVAHAFRTIVFSCIAHLQANERGLLETDDAEYLHQARVALRRLRSALSVFNRAFPRALFEELIVELRWLGSCLGPARDWDVFATETLPVVCAAFPSEPGLHWLTERTAELRTAADSGAREAIASTRYTVLLLKLTGIFLREPWLAWVDEQAAALRSLPLTEFASGVLERRHKKVLKSGHGLADLDPVELHALRIEIKKLRYATDFFSALYNKAEVREYLTTLADLQELLGGLNDAVTVERLLEPLRESDGAGQWLEAPGLIRGWAACGSRARLDQLGAAWQRFRDCKTFWH
jgi:inorganic triphosphatase YgiF